MKFNIFTLVILAMIGFIPHFIHAQTFTEVPTSIQALFNSSDWGDFDSDGDLDLLITGSSVLDPMNARLIIYSNQGSGQFTVSTDQNLVGFQNSNAKWLDYNNDGILDIFLSGLYYNDLMQWYYPTTRLYKGIENKKFDLVSNRFDDMSQASIDWGDYNNDGRADIAICGYTQMNPSYHGKVYENMGDTLAESEHFKINALINGTLKWGDYDGDQDLDLLQTGWYYDWAASKDVYATTIYRNDGDNFTIINDQGILGFIYSSAEWGDYDNDGDLDILVSGNDGNGSSSLGSCLVYRNDGNDKFTKVFGIERSTKVFRVSKWGDIDNDGDLDIIISVQNQSLNGGVTSVYKNDNGEFTFFKSIGSVPAITLDVVDYDNDGDLDVFLMGTSNYTIQAKLLNNNTSETNQKPTAPTGLKSEINKHQVRFSWDRSTDDHTASKSLSYNLSVGTLPSNALSMEPNSDLASGYRKLVRTGNTSLDTCWNLNIKQAARYYWKVQAIDNCYTGSAFSETGSFVVGSPVVFTEPASEISYTVADLNGKVNPFDLSASVFFEYGTDSVNLIKTAAIIVQGDSLFNVKANVLNLTQDTLYYYRIIAMNELDTVYGKFLTLHTASDGIVEIFRNISIYPNPNNGIFRLGISDLPEGTVLIYDQTGRTRASFNSIELRNFNYIDISNFEAGSYLLHYRTDKYSYRCLIEKF